MKTPTLKCQYPTCKRSFNFERSLNNHVNAIHREVGTFQCQVCRKKLSSKQNLKEHTYKHTGEAPYFCQEMECNASFRHGSQLSSHKKVHEQIPQDSVFYGIQLSSLLDIDTLFFKREIEYSRDLYREVELPAIVGSQVYCKVGAYEIHS